MSKMATGRPMRSKNTTILSADPKYAAPSKPSWCVILSACMHSCAPATAPHSSHRYCT